MAALANPGSSHNIDSEVCPSCGDFVDQLDSTTGWCAECSPQQERLVNDWLTQNADHIEHYMVTGSTVAQAISKVCAEVKPTCAVCGKPMLRAKRSAVICRRNKQCRYTARRYIYLYQQKGYTKAEALAQALGES